MSGVRAVIVTGEIDISAADAVTALLRDAMAGPGVTEIVVDVAGVTFCDAAGIRVLYDAYTRAAAGGIHLRLTNVQQLVRRVLRITGLLDTLTSPPPAGRL